MDNDIEIGNIVLGNEIEIGEIVLDVRKVYPELEEAIVQSRAEQQVIEPEKYGFSRIVVKPIEILLQDKEITQNGTYEADEQYDGLGKINVNVSEAVVEQIYSYTEEVWN